MEEDFLLTSTHCWLHLYLCFVDRLCLLSVYPPFLSIPSLPFTFPHFWPIFPKFFWASQCFVLLLLYVLDFRRRRDSHPQYFNSLARYLHPSIHFSSSSSSGASFFFPFGFFFPLPALANGGGTSLFGHPNFGSVKILADFTFCPLPPPGIIPNPNPSLPSLLLHFGRRRILHQSVGTLPSPPFNVCHSHFAPCCWPIMRGCRPWRLCFILSSIRSIHRHPSASKFPSSSSLPLPFSVPSASSPICHSFHRPFPIPNPIPSVPCSPNPSSKCLVPSPPLLAFGAAVSHCCCLPSGLSSSPSSLSRISPPLPSPPLHHDSPSLHPSFIIPMLLFLPLPSQFIIFTFHLF